MQKKWWHKKTAYQIYPKSFCDSNGDGIGDLPGIISKLDYLKDLGIDIIWLSPIYCSPLADQGYDISDYYNIDPRFGTMEDMDTLIAEAKKRGMYILMDLVVNHCSDEHEWFKKACEDPDGEYGKYFYIEDCPDGKLPCNWRSYFGGSVWEPLPGHQGKYYLHMFHKKQPDLNWENPKLRDEIYKMINWWLDKGLAGFRIDAIINIKKALPWQDFPADRADGMCSPGEMLRHAVGVGEFLGEMRDRTFQPHGAFTVGEVFDEKPEELPDFIGSNGYFSTMFDFNETIFGGSKKGWYDQTPITPNDYRSCCFASQKKIGDIGMLTAKVKAKMEKAKRRLELAKIQRGGKTEAEASGDTLYSIYKFFCGSVPRLVLTSIIIIVLSFTGLKVLKIDTALINYFPKNCDFRKDVDHIDQQYAGSNCLFFVIQGQEKGDISNPELLKAVDNMQHYLTETGSGSDFGTESDAAGKTMGLRKRAHGIAGSIKKSPVPAPGIHRRIFSLHTILSYFSRPYAGIS